MSAGKRTIKRVSGFTGVDFRVEPRLLKPGLLPFTANMLPRGGKLVRSCGRERLSAGLLNGGAFFGTTGRITYLKQLFDLGRNMTDQVPGKSIVVAHDETSGVLKVIQDTKAVSDGATAATSKGLVENFNDGASGWSAIDHVNNPATSIQTYSAIGQRNFCTAGPCFGYKAWRAGAKWTGWGSKTITRIRLILTSLTWDHSGLVSGTDSLEVYALNYGTLDYTNDWAVGTLLYTLDYSATLGSTVTIEMSRTAFNYSGSLELQFVSKAERTGTPAIRTVSAPGDDYSATISFTPTLLVEAT